MEHTGPILLAKITIILIRTKKMGVFLVKKEFTEIRIYESTEQLWLMDIMEKEELKRQFNEY